MDVPPQPAIVVVQLAEQRGPSEASLAARAVADGWTSSQAEWIGKLGMAALDAKSGTAGADAFEETYKQGRKALTAAYFDNALKEGKNRLVAFLTVIDLEKQLAERSRSAVPTYTDEWLEAAYVELAQAAKRGASSADQLDIGFAVLRARAGAAQ